MGVILGLSGLAGVGKDTVAEMLVSKYHFCSVAFADPIKRAAMDWWDFSEEQLWGHSKMRNEPDKRYSRLVPTFDEGDAFEANRYGLEDPMQKQHLTPRYVLQCIGTEIVRSLDEDVWLRYGLKVANQLLQQPSKLNYKKNIGIVKEKRKEPIIGVVISDCRFTNELEHIRKEGGKLVRIKRSGAGLVGDAAKHTSETEHQTWPDSAFDYCLDNNGTLVDLPGKVVDMVEILLGKPKPSKQLELF